MGPMISSLTSVVESGDNTATDALFSTLSRNHSAMKRGGELKITSLEADIVASPPDAKELSLISDVLDQLAKVEPDLAEVVDLKFFCGFSFAEIAALQKVSERTVQRMWEKARIYLRCSIRTDLAL